MASIYRTRKILSKYRLDTEKEGFMSCIKDPKDEQRAFHNLTYLLQTVEIEILRDFFTR